MPRPNSRDSDDPAVVLGKHLRRLRLAAKFTTQDALAKAMGYVREVVTKCETGERVPSDDVFAAWLDACQVPDDKREFLTDLLKLARKSDGSAVPQWAEWWLRAEAAADFLRLWALDLLPGLLQVYEYAHAMYLLGGLDEGAAADRAATRIRRQAILEGPEPARVTAVIYEPVLYRLVGSPGVMVEQLTHLLEVSHQANMVIQVVRDTGYFPGVRGQFEIASGRAIPDTLNMITIEDQTTDTPAMVDHAAGLFERIRGYALTIEESRALIQEALERWKSQQET